MNGYVLINRAIGLIVGLMMYYTTKDISLAVLVCVLTVIQETLIDIYRRME